MPADETRYSCEAPTRYLIRRAEDQVLRLTWTIDGARVAPTPGTVTVRRPGGSLVSSGAFTVNVDGVTAEYTVDAADTTSLPLEQGWLAVWDATLPDGTTREFAIEAALVRYRIAPPASYDDLYGLQSRLDPSHPSPLTRDMSLEAKRLDAWEEIEDRLYYMGRRPELIMSPGVFRRPHALLWASMVFADLRSSNYAAYSDTADSYRRMFEDAWNLVSFAYDADEDGLIDGGGEPVRAGSETSVWLTGLGGYSWD